MNFLSEIQARIMTSIKNKLGNLTLLEKPLNIVASNDYFSKKKTEYRKCKNYLTSSIAELNTVGKNSSINRINDKLCSFDGWNSNDIDKRHALLSNLVKDIWRTEEVELD